MASVEHNYNLNTRGSKLTYLTSGQNVNGNIAPIMFAANGQNVKAVAVSTKHRHGNLISFG